jgi:hypothetical protein
MKKLVLLAMTVFLLHGEAISQSCLPNGIQFTTQSAIDNFHNNYPGCTQIGGSVTILGGDIHNLNGLSGITSIGGNLWILVVGSLNNISGLNSLTYIGGSVRIDGALYLTSLSGLSSLEYIGGSLSIGDYDGNDNLTDLNGLQNLETIGGGLQIWFNNNLVSLSGLDNLASIGGDIDLYYNYKLASLNGLGGLNAIPGYFSINNNGPLLNLSGLEALISIGGGLEIALCYELESLEGLENLISIGGTLDIGFNSGLSNLEGLSSLATIGGDLSLDNNDGLTSLAGLEELTTVEGNIEILANDGLTSLTGLDNLTSVGGDVSIHNNSSLGVLTGMNSLASVGRDILIYDNPALPGLTGLENIATVGRDLYIHGNPELVDLSGLDGLASIGRNFEISDNDLLTSLAGLESINPESITNLNILDNAFLASCDVASICEYLASPNGIVNIHTNAAGCNYPHEIADACGIGIPCLPYGNYYFYYQADVDSFPANYPGCTELGGSVMISGSAITNLEGLNLVTSIENNLIIHANGSLTDLNPLINLAFVGGTLQVTNSNGLTSLSGLDNIDPFSMSSLQVQNNSALSECDMENICYFINNFSPISYISGNATGCASLQQVAAACGVLSAEVKENTESCTVYPNPCNGIADFRFRISDFGKVTLQISDLQGREVANLIDENLSAGNYTVTWNSGDLPPGIYFYRFTFDGLSFSGKLILLN